LGIGDLDGGQDVGIAGDDRAVITRVRDCRTDKERDNGCIYLLFLKSALSKLLDHPTFQPRPIDCRRVEAGIDGASCEGVTSRHRMSNVLDVCRAYVIPVLKATRRYRPS